MVSLIAAGLAGLALIRLDDILPLILIAMILSFLLNPVAVFIDERILVVGRLRRRRTHGIAVALTIFGALFIFIVILLILIPILITQLQDFGNSLPGIIEDSQEFLQRELSKPLTFRGEPLLINDEEIILWDRLLEALGVSQEEGGNLVNLDNFDFLGIARQILTSVGSFSGTAVGIFGSAVSNLINFILLLSMMAYLMSDGRNIIRKGVELTPPDYRNDVERLLYELASVWNAYLRGQLLQSTLVGIIVFIAATALGLPNAPILGLLSGIGEFIPNIGAFIALVPAVILALFAETSNIGLSGPAFALVVAVIWTLFIQQFSGLVLQPRIMGDSLNLHPLVIIIAVIAGASIAGAFGVILAAPMAASIRVLADYTYGKLMDIDPFPAYELEQKRQKKPGRLSPRRVFGLVNIVLPRRKHIELQQSPSEIESETASSEVN